MIDPADREPTVREQLEAVHSLTMHPAYGWLVGFVEERMLRCDESLRSTPPDGGHAAAEAAAWRAYDKVRDWAANTAAELQATLDKGERDG